jgi:hypothetical protein
VIYYYNQADAERDIAVARSQLIEADFEAAWVAGRTLTLEEAVAEALALAEELAALTDPPCP